MRALAGLAILTACSALPARAGAQWMPAARFELELTREMRAATASDTRNGTSAPRVSGGVHAQSGRADPWFGPDKVRHFFVSAAIQSLGYGVLRAFDVEHGGALGGASVVTAGFGVGKELSDRRRGYGVSARDLVWDAAGAAAVSLLLASTER
jgi:uncharacterized protein YfiM (DUF2279 family)